MAPKSGNSSIECQLRSILCGRAADIGSKSKFTKCPSCNSVEVESMPIAKNELYKFDYYSKGGITLEFSNAIKF